VWRIALLAKGTRLRSSARLCRSLGTYRPSRSQITLAAWLFDDAPRTLLEEVLCHEAAHAAVHLTHARRVRPHGAEWRAFMLAVGRQPRVRIPSALIPDSQKARLSRGRHWEHRCPVCRATRMARVRVTRWRCRRCVEAGREGRLVIERIGGEAHGVA
jgi:SprT protein